MENNSLEDILKKIAEVKEIGRKNSRHLSPLIFLDILFILIGIGFSYLFRVIDSQEQYLVVLGLLSQVVAFLGAIMLSEQFLSVPEKYRGIYDYVLAAVMLAPSGMWIGSFIYSLLAVLLAIPYSELFMKAVTIIFLGISMVIFAVGSMEEALLSLKIKNKSAVVATGWYLMVFSLGIQIYISLIELGIV